MDLMPQPFFKITSILIVNPCHAEQSVRECKTSSGVVTTHPKHLLRVLKMIASLGVHENLPPIITRKKYK